MHDTKLRELNFIYIWLVWRWQHDMSRHMVHVCWWYLQLCFRAPIGEHFQKKKTCNDMKKTGIVAIFCPVIFHIVHSDSLRALRCIHQSNVIKLCASLIRGTDKNILVRNGSVLPLEVLLQLSFSLTLLIIDWPYNNSCRMPSKKQPQIIVL